MGKRKKIAIIGHFGGKENFLDGQTVKTKILFEELAAFTDWNIRKVDTYYRKKNPIKLLLCTLVTLFTTKDIIVLLSGGGMRVYFPLLNAFAKLFHTRVYHDVIGGNLDSFVQRNANFKKYLNSFRVNWVETDSLKQRLEALGITNAQVLPNFKRLNVVEEGSAQIQNQEPYRFCTFSRVMEEKGIETAIQAIEEINEQAGRTLCMLDIYGKIDEGYTVRFEEIQKNMTSAVRYGGMIPFDKSVEVIREYYALLFPTHWSGEGFAGTIVDAFSAGLPVIATDWNCNNEIIIDGTNGILYPNVQIKTLTEAILWAVRNPVAVFEMKKNCIQCAQMYQPDQYIKKIVRMVEEHP